MKYDIYILWYMQLADLSMLILFFEITTGQTRNSEVHYFSFGRAKLGPSFTYGASAAMVTIFHWRKRTFQSSDVWLGSLTKPNHPLHHYHYTHTNSRNF